MGLLTDSVPSWHLAPFTIFLRLTLRLVLTAECLWYIHSFCLCWMWSRQEIERCAEVTCFNLQHVLQCSLPIGLTHATSKRRTSSPRVYEGAAACLTLTSQLFVVKTNCTQLEGQYWKQYCKTGTHMQMSSSGWLKAKLLMSQQNFLCLLKSLQQL